MRTVNLESRFNYYDIFRNRKSRNFSNLVPFPSFQTCHIFVRNRMYKCLCSIFFFNCYKCTLHLSWRIRCYWKEWFKRITKNTLKSFSLIQILLSTIIIFQKITFRSYSFANNKLFITNLINVFRRMSISEISIFIEGISMRRRSLSSPIPEWYSRTRVSTFSRT